MKMDMKRTTMNIMRAKVKIVKIKMPIIVTIIIKIAIVVIKRKDAKNLRNVASSLSMLHAKILLIYISMAI
jgi:hypothetical protein